MLEIVCGGLNFTVDCVYDTIFGFSQNNCLKTRTISLLMIHRGKFRLYLNEQSIQSILLMILIIPMNDDKIMLSNKNDIKK